MPHEECAPGLLAAPLAAKRAARGAGTAESRRDEREKQERMMRTVLWSMESRGNTCTEDERQFMINLRQHLEFGSFSERRP